ncbi:NaeI family type II restriction endonuclease [Deinococcus grandis]|uniref:NaeI family type II restriction endonuclease n=1 Tax=Deinococcus grandis TaxID=57498 RepID=UPI00073E5CF9|nr:NaeI family type II restriction endonuclease [Deinococcus grandis]
MPFTVSDVEVEHVAHSLIQAAGGEANLESFFGALIRQAIDEVVDGPRTGRIQYSSLTPEEKKYVGTKLEIILRNELEYPRGRLLDLDVQGIEADIKWSQGSAWMIPRDYDDTTRHSRPPVCLLIGTHMEDSLEFNVGVARANLITGGRNRDGKGSLRASHVDQVVGSTATWLVRRGQLAPTFLATLPGAAVDRIMAARKGQARVNQLFTETVGRPVPRSAVETMAQQKDPLRRTRQDASRSTASALPFLVLSGVWKAHQEAARQLTGHTLKKDELMAVSHEALAKLPAELLSRVRKEP